MSSRNPSSSRSDAPHHRGASPRRQRASDGADDSPRRPRKASSRTGGDKSKSRSIKSRRASTAASSGDGEAMRDDSKVRSRPRRRHQQSREIVTGWSRQSRSPSRTTSNSHDVAMRQMMQAGQTDNKEDVEQPQITPEEVLKTTPGMTAEEMKLLFGDTEEVEQAIEWSRNNQNNQNGSNIINSRTTTQRSTHGPRRDNNDKNGVDIDRIIASFQGTTTAHLKALKELKKEQKANSKKDSIDMTAVDGALTSQERKDFLDLRKWYSSLVEKHTALQQEHTRLQEEHEILRRENKLLELKVRHAPTKSNEVSPEMQTNHVISTGFLDPTETKGRKTKRKDSVFEWRRAKTFAVVLSDEL